MQASAFGQLSSSCIPLLSDLFGFGKHHMNLLLTLPVLVTMQYTSINISNHGSSDPFYLVSEHMFQASHYVYPHIVPISLSLYI